MKRQTLAAISSLLAGIVTLCAAPQAVAENWPQRPVKLVVGYAVGGPADIVARALANELGKTMNQSFIVEPRPGGGAVIATDYVINSKDGHTILFNSTGSHSVKPYVMTLRHDPWRDLKPVTVVGVAPYVFVARKDLGVDTLGALAQYGKENPGKLSMGVAGNGTINHLVSGMFLNDAGVDAVTVPYAGAAPVLQSMLAGEIDFAVLDPGAALPFIKDGKLTPLAVTDSTRMSFMPEVPTVIEAGFANAEGVALWSLFVPSSTSDEVVNKLREGVAHAVQTPEFQKVLEQRLMLARMTTPQELIDLIRQEEVRYQKAIEILDLKMQ